MAQRSILWWFRTVAIFFFIAVTIWSGIRPGADDSRKWYDRTIRALGGLIILLALGFGLILQLRS
jgi:hypothetical protein